MVDRLVKGDPFRRSRLHDTRGNLADPESFAFAPLVLAEFIMSKALGYRPAKPWLAYHALAKIRSAIPIDGTILEYGAGMSTIWWARRAWHVFSVENDPVWYRIVEAELRRRGIANVTLCFRPTPDRDGALRYAAAPEEHTEQFDFALIDGACRDLCSERATKLVRPGGFVYLDNTDYAAQQADFARAETTLLQAAAAGTPPRYFTGFAPAQIHANQGMLVQL